MTDCEQFSTRLLQRQDALELKALALLQHPDIVAARREGEAALLASVARADTRTAARFAEASQELTLNAMMNVIDDGSALPQLRLIQRPGHTIAGNAVPGNRGLDDNPDTYYRIIPMTGATDFVLEGQWRPHPALIFELSLLSKNWETLGNLSRNQIECDAEGRFSVHVGYAPKAAGHFIQNADSAEMLIVRETLADWQRQQPAYLRVTAAEGRAAGGGGPAGESGVAAAAARVRKWFQQTIGLHTQPLSMPANQFPQPVIRNERGMLVTQAYSIGHFQLRDDEALVLTIDPGDASYVVVPVTNLWGISEEPALRQTTLNTAQADRNHDGTYTFVVAAADPGVRNWVDTGDLRQGFIFLRWAGLGEQQNSARPGISVAARLTTIDRLGDCVPPETAWIDAGARRAALQQRAADYRRRFID